MSFPLTAVINYACLLFCSNQLKSESQIMPNAGFSLLQTFLLLGVPADPADLGPGPAGGRVRAGAEMSRSRLLL